MHPVVRSSPNRTGVRPTLDLLGKPTIKENPASENKDAEVHTLISDFDDLAWPLAPDRERGLIRLIDYLRELYTAERNPPSDVSAHLMRVCPRQSTAFKHLQTRAPHLMK